MCPVCIGTAALVAASAGSTGGLTALLARALRRRSPRAPIVSETSFETRAGTIAARQIPPQGASK
jgi:hypothetical protein